MLLRSLKLHFLAAIKYHVSQLLSKTPVPYIHMFVANTEDSMTCIVFSKEPLQNKKNSLYTLLSYYLLRNRCIIISRGGEKTRISR